ncbi:hypothetical protein D3OALGA1CA_4021 [Olavius algarvensis associated proteobacterium Delta 3]|nr:hypothetical protein D3OALGB2SA_3419 [Olavius algarvensis associated proteobacterium Delta 3]CAB5143849.1 hypothetical protein D3OALGA1CA_4021 [Olavius algarvensis associated proteobacterium Delta 3]
MLSATRHHVEAFLSSEEFLQIQSIDDHACLIMDAWVSGLSGKHLETVVAPINVNLPVIFLSARDGKESRDRALAAKAEGFFRKPEDGPALLDAVSWAPGTHPRNLSAKEKA